MKIIGAGYPRTGTMSTQAALQFLGYRCYHMSEVPMRNGHLTRWNRLLHDRKEMNWEAVFGNYDATVDAPACFYYQDLMERYPDAMVILTIRDPECWYSSLEVLYKTASSFAGLGPQVPELKKFLVFGHCLLTHHGINPNDKTSCIEAFNRHNQSVMENVPTNRLLVFRVSDGWRPLCDCLKRDEPEAVTFPHLNQGGETLRSIIREVFLNHRPPLESDRSNLPPLTELGAPLTSLDG